MMVAGMACGVVCLDRAGGDDRSDSQPGDGLCR
jgi:hypothetical protein